MSKLIRVNINLDNSHSLTDFPVDIYSGTTTTNATNLVISNVTTSPIDLTVDDELLTFGLKLVSTGCLDQVLLIESPRVDCEMCADFVEQIETTPQTTQTVLESCINSLTFVVEYNGSGANGSPCPGGHGCNRAKFDIMANNVNIGQVNMNNAGGIYDDVNRPPNYPNYPGASAGDRYNALSVTSQQAVNIANNSSDGLIDFSFDCACIWSGPNQNCQGSTCHTDVSWVRIIKDMGLSTEEELYNGCPNGNFIEDFDPCPPQPTPSETPLSTPNATPNVTPNPTPNATPDATPLPTNGATPNPTSTPNSTPVPTPTPTPECLCYRTIPYDDTMFVVYKDCDGNQVTINKTCNSRQCQGIEFSATEIVSGQSDVFIIDCNEPTSTPNATPDATPNATPDPTPTSNCTNYTLVPDQGETTATFRWQECGSNEFSSWTGLSGDQRIVCAETGTVSVVSGYGSIFTGNECNSDETPSPSPTTETIMISGILLSNTTSSPTNANCNESNGGEVENRVYVIYNTSWFTTVNGVNVVKSTAPLSDNEIINGPSSGYTIHPNSMWSGTPSVVTSSSDGTYMISDESTEGSEKLLFVKNGNYGTTDKCNGGKISELD